MKKAILYSLLISLLFFSCKKDHKSPITPIDTAKKTYNVHFNVSGFTQQIVNSINKVKTNALKTSDVPHESGYENILYYFVYTTKGTLVHQITLPSDSASFGSITDKLPAGKYTVVFAAGKTGFTLPASWFTYLFYQTPGENKYTWHDTFYKKIDLTVTSGDVSQDVTMDRMVGELEVNIEDAIPVEAKNIIVTVTSEFSNFYFLTNTLSDPYIKADTITLADTSKGHTNFKIYSILANTTKPFTVQISSYNASNALIANVVAANVTCTKNTRTILSGNLYGSDKTFQVSVNGTWDPDPFITIDY